MLYLNPDFRRDAPDHGPYCARCQKPVDPKTAIRVTVDWLSWIVTEGGNDLLGPDCWEKINEASHG